MLRSCFCSVRLLRSRPFPPVLFCAPTIVLILGTEKKPVITFTLTARFLFLSPVPGSPQSSPVPGAITALQGLPGLGFLGCSDSLRQKTQTEIAQIEARASQWFPAPPVPAWLLPAVGHGQLQQQHLSVSRGQENWPMPHNKGQKRKPGVMLKSQSG